MNCSIHKNHRLYMQSDDGNKIRVCIDCKIAEKNTELYRNGLKKYEEEKLKRIKEEQNSKDAIPMFIIYIFLYFATNIVYIMFMWAVFKRESVTLHLIGFAVSIILTIILGGKWKRKKLDEIDHKIIQLQNDTYRHPYFLTDIREIIKNQYPEDYAAYQKIEKEREFQREKKFQKKRKKKYKEYRNLSTEETPKDYVAYQKIEKEREFQREKIFQKKREKEYKEYRNLSTEETRIQRRLKKSRENSRRNSPNIHINDLYELTPIQFEHFIALLLDKLGYTNVKVTKGSGDLGVDILCKDSSGKRTAVQCKRYAENNTVGFDAIKEVNTAKQLENCSRAIVVATSKFTKQAIVTSEKLKIELWDKRYLQEILVKAEIKKYDVNNIKQFS